MGVEFELILSGGFKFKLYVLFEVIEKYLIFEGYIRKNFEKIEIILYIFI